MDIILNMQTSHTSLSLCSSFCICAAGSNLYLDSWNVSTAHQECCSNTTEWFTAIYRTTVKTLVGPESNHKHKVNSNMYSYWLFFVVVVPWVSYFNFLISLKCVYVHTCMCKNQSQIKIDASKLSSCLQFFFLFVCFLGESLTSRWQRDA